MVNSKIPQGADQTGPKKYSEERKTNIQSALSNKYCMCMHYMPLVSYYPQKKQLDYIGRVIVLPSGLRQQIQHQSHVYYKACTCNTNRSIHSKYIQYPQ